MKRINVKLSDESYKILIDFKLDKNLKKLDDALDLILKEIKKLKGGVK